MTWSCPWLAKGWRTASLLMFEQPVPIVGVGRFDGLLGDVTH